MYIKSIKKREKEVLKVQNGFLFYTNYLFEKCCRLFKWDNLPTELPQKEIETRLIMNGYCGFMEDSCGYLVANGGLSGVTQYADEFVYFTYATPVTKSHTKKIHKDCVIIDNNTLRNSLFEMIERYASLLAHADATLKCVLVNDRKSDTYSTEDRNVAESVNDYLQTIYDGTEKAIIDSSMIQNIQNVANNNKNIDSRIILETKRNILGDFLEQIGVKYSNDKKERMITEEINSSNQMLLLNINDMLNSRKKACEEINSIFGLNISVDLSEEFKILDNVSRETSQKDGDENEY